MPDEQMRAIICSQWCDYNDLVLTKVARPSLVNGQARVHIRFVGVSFATTLVVAGKYQRKPPLPFSPGTEIAGEVIEVADGVTRVRAGDIVFGAIDWGGYAEEVTVAATNLHVLPDGLEIKNSVALAISYPTAYGGLVWRANLKKGQTLLVLGAAGGVGLAAIEIGCALGANVIGVASTKEKRSAVEGHGGRTIDGFDLKKKIMKMTNERGVDVIFDPVGGDNARQVLGCLAPDGRLVSIGFASGIIPKVGYNIFLVKNIAVMGFNYGEYVGWGPVDNRNTYTDRVDATQKKLLDWWQSQAIKPTIHACFQFDDFRDAMAEVMKRKAVGRVVLEIGN